MKKICFVLLGMFLTTMAINFAFAEYKDPLISAIIERLDKMYETGFEHSVSIGSIIQMRAMENEGKFVDQNELIKRSKIILEKIKLETKHNMKGEKSNAKRK